MGYGHGVGLMGLFAISTLTIWADGSEGVKPPE